MSLSDSVDYTNKVDLREVVRTSNEEMGRSGVARKRSLPFKSLRSKAERVHDDFGWKWKYFWRLAMLAASCS